MWITLNTVERILKLIKEKGITEKQFYDDLELGRNKLSQWKQGTTESYRKYINQIAEYLNTSVAYLLCETDDPTPPDKKNRSESNIDPELEKDILELQEIAENLTIEDIKYLIKFAKSLNSERDE